MFCQNCGKEVANEADICLSCGYVIEKEMSKFEPTKPVVNENDKKSFWWGFLSAWFPLIGIVLFAIWRAEKPLTAKSCAVGAIIGFVVSFVLGFVLGLSMITANFLNGFIV